MAEAETEKPISEVVKICGLSEKTEAADEKTEDSNNNDIITEIVCKEGDKHEDTTRFASEEQNVSNMNSSTDDIRNDIETEFKERGSSDSIKGSAHEEDEMHEDVTNSSSKEQSQRVDKDICMIDQDKEDDSERVSQPGSQEHCHNMIANLEATGNDIGTVQEVNSINKPIDDLSTSHPNEYDMGGGTDPEEVKDQISTKTNVNEDSGIELLVGKDVDEKTGERRRTEGEAAERIGFHKDQMETEKLGNHSESEHGEFSGVADGTVETVAQRETEEDNTEETFELVQGKTLTTEEGNYTQDDINVEYKHDVVTEKPEETSSSGWEEETPETIGANIGLEADRQAKELSQKHEPAQASVPEDNIRESISQNDYTKIDNLTDDCILKHMIAEAVVPNDEQGNIKVEAYVNKELDECCGDHVSVTETIQGEVGQEKEEGSSYTSEEQIHLASVIEDNIKVDVPEEVKEAPQSKFIPESLPEDECPKQAEEPDAINIDDSTNDDNSQRMVGSSHDSIDIDVKNMTPDVAELTEHAESTEEKDEANLNVEIVEFSDGYTITAPILSEQTGECEDDSKNMCGEQIYQAIDGRHSKEVGSHEEKADSEELDKFPESAAKDDVQGDAREPISIDNLVHNLDKAIPQILGHNADSETKGVEHKNVLKDTGDVSDRLQPVVRACFEGKGEKHENSCHITNIEDKKEDTVEEEREILDINSEEVHEDQDASAGTESHQAEKARLLDKEKISSPVAAKNASDAPAGSSLNETVVGHGCMLESDDKQETISISEIKEEEATKKDISVENISEKSSGAVNYPEVISENQMEENDVPNISANSELTGYEEKQKFEEVIPEVANREQNKENYDADKNPKNETAIEENSQPLDKIGNFETQTSEDANQVTKVDAYGCQDNKENIECTKATLDKNMQDASMVDQEEKVVSPPEDNEDNNEEQDVQRSLQIEELEDKLREEVNESQTEQNSDESSETRENNENESLDKLETTRNVSEKARIEDLEPGKSSIIILDHLEATIGSEGIQENEMEKQSTKNNNEDNFPKDGDMKILETAKGLEPGNQTSKSTSTSEGPSPNEEDKEADDRELKGKQTATVSLGEDVNLDTLTEANIIDTLNEMNTTEHPENEIIDKQDNGEPSVKEPCENDQISEDGANDGEASGSSLLAQEVEGVELKNADKSINGEESNKVEEIRMDEEDYTPCPGEPKNGFNEPVPAKIEETTNDHDKDSELVTQMDTEATDDNLHDDKDSLDKNIQYATEIAPEENVLSMPKDNNIEATAVSENENKEERDVLKSLQKKESEEEPKEKEHKIQTEQEKNEASDVNENNKNKSFKENDLEMEKLEDPNTEKLLGVAHEDFETTIETEDTHEREIKEQCTENKNEQHFLKDEDMKLEASETELAPSDQSDKSVHANEGSSPNEESLNVKGLIKDVAKVDAQNNEGNDCKIAGDLPVTHKLIEASKNIEGPVMQEESVEPETHEKVEHSDNIATQNEEIAEVSESSNKELQKNTKELMQLDKCQSITSRIENIEKSIVSKEDAAGSSHELVHEDETLVKDNTETDTGSIPNDEYKHDVVTEEPEETSGSGWDEETPETIGANIELEADRQAKELSQKHEHAQASVPEDNIKEIISQNDYTKIDNLTDDCILKHMIAEAVAPNDEQGNIKVEAYANKELDERCGDHVSLKETIQDEVGQENEEGSGYTSEEQIHRVTVIEDNIDVDVPEEVKEAPQSKIIPESLPEDECPKQAEEPNAINIDDLTNDDGSQRMTPDVAELTEHAESTEEKDEANLHAEIVDFSDGHTTTAPILSEQTGETEDDSKNTCGEQAIDDKHSKKDGSHEEKADSEELEKFPESAAKDDVQGDAREPISIDNLVHTLDKAIPQILGHNADPKTTKVEHKNVLKDTGDVPDRLQSVVEACFDGEGEKRENSCDITNIEDKKEDTVEEEREILDINPEEVHEDLSHDASAETESHQAKKTQLLDKVVIGSAVAAKNASDAPAGSSSNETVIGHDCMLESDDKQETISILEIQGKEATKKDISVENILEKSLGVVNYTEVISENQMEENDVSELTGYEEKQKFEEVIPEVANREQNKESYDGDKNTKNETAIEENSQPSDKIGNVETQTSEDANQVTKVDAYCCQDNEENVECKKATLDKNMQDASIVDQEEKDVSPPEDNEDNSIGEKTILKNDNNEEQDLQKSLQIEELEDKLREEVNESQTEQNSDESSKTRENNENESLKEQKTIEHVSEKARLEDLEPGKSPIVVHDHLEATIGSEDMRENEMEKQSTKNNNEDNFPKDGDMNLFVSATGLEPDNQTKKSTSTSEGPSSNEEDKEADDGELKGKQTATVSLGEDVNLDILTEANTIDTLTEMNTTEHPENKFGSLIIKQNHEEPSVKEPCENDKISEGANDGEASGPSLLAQEVEGVELKKADKSITEEESNKVEEIRKDEEDYTPCPGEPQIGFNEPTPAKTEETTNDTDEKDKDPELVTQMDTEAMDDNLHDDKDSLDKNIQYASEIAPEENVLSMPKDNSIETNVVSENENKEERDVQKSLQKEESEEETKEKEYKIQTEQENNESSDVNENNKNKSFKEENTTENDLEMEKLEDPKTEKLLVVALEDLETTTETEDTHEREIKEQYTENKNGQHFLKDENMKLEASETELAPSDQSDKSVHANEGSSPSEESLNLKGLVEDVAKVDAQNNEGKDCKIAGDLPVTHKLVEASKNTEEGPLLQKESVEPETHEKGEHSDNIATQNEEIADVSESSKKELQKDTKELMQFDECRSITGRIENLEKSILEDAAGSSHELVHEDETQVKDNTETDTGSIPNDKVKDSEGEGLQDKQTEIMSDDSLPDLPASNEEAEQAENANRKAVDSPTYTEQIESVCLSEDARVGMLLKRDYALTIDKQDNEKLIGEGVCENDKTSEEDRTTNGQTSSSSLLAQAEEGADDLASEEKQEMLELENNEGAEILKTEEVYNPCLSSNIGSNKPIVDEVKISSHELTEKAEVTNETEEKADDAELVSQMDVETTGDNLHVNEAPIDKRIHDASEVVPQEKTVSMPEDNSTKVNATSENENKGKQDTQTSLQKEDQEDELEEKESEIPTEQKSEGPNDASQKDENKNSKEKHTAENDLDEEKLGGQEPEKPPNVALEYLETMIGNEDTSESETNKECSENKNEKNFLKDGEMKLVDTGIESEPSSQSDESTHAIKESSHGEEALNVKDPIEDVAKIDAHNNEGGNLYLTHDMAEGNKIIEGPLLRSGSVEPEAHEKAKQSDSTAAQNEEIADISQQLNLELQEDTEEPRQLQECSTTSFRSQEINDDIENIEMNVEPEEDAVGSSIGLIQEDVIRANNIETNVDSVSKDEVKESEGDELKDKQTATLGGDSLADIPANEESGRIEDAHEKDVDSPNAEPIKSISLSEGVNLDILTKPNTTEDLEGDYASIIGKPDHESGTGVHENDKINEKDGTFGGEVSASSLLAQMVKETDELVFEEKCETLELRKNTEEQIPKKGEVFTTCIGASTSIGFDEPIVAEVESLSFKMTEKTEEATSDADEKAKDAELVPQMDIETMGDNHVNEASLDKRICDSSEVVPEDNVPSTPEDNNKEVGAASGDENKEEQDVQTISQKKELKDELQAKENEMQTEQKPKESSNTAQKSENETIIENDATENDIEKEKLEVPEIEIFPIVGLEGHGTEDTREHETNIECTANKNETNFPKDEEMKLANLDIESEPTNQSEKANHTNEGLSHGEEMLNVKGLAEDIAKVDPQTNEGNNYKIVGDFSVTRDMVGESVDMHEGSHLPKVSDELEIHDKAEQIDSTAAENKETAEISETLNTELQEDTDKYMQPEELLTISLGSQVSTDGIENNERTVASHENAVGSSPEQIQENETQATNNETGLDSVPNDEIKEYNHQPSNESIMMMNKSDNIGTSSSTSVAEETKQEVYENFSKISDYWPEGHNDKTSAGDEMNTEHSKEEKKYAKQPHEDENFAFTSVDSTAAEEISMKDVKGYVTEDSGLDAVHNEGREVPTEASVLVPKEEEEEDLKINSLTELTENEDKLHEGPAIQEPKITETNQQADTASHEVESDNLHEEKQLTSMGELPVSQFLMKYILQGEGDTHKEALADCESVADEQNEVNEKNDAEQQKKEEDVVLQSDIQITEKTSNPEEKVSSDKLQKSSESVQTEEYTDVKDNSEITSINGKASPRSTFDGATPRLQETDDINDRIAILSSGISTHAKDNSMELISTEQSISGVTAEHEEHRREPDLAKNEKSQATVFEEMITEKEIQKDHEALDEDVNVSTFGDGAEEISQKEAGIGTAERLQDVGKVKASYGESVQQATMNEDQHGEMSEIKPEVIKVECAGEKEDITSQVQTLKTDLQEELKQSDSQKDSQPDCVVGADIHAFKVEDKDTLASIDEKQIVETVEAKMDVSKTDDEKYMKEEVEEYKSSCSAKIGDTEDPESKPVQESDQTSESPESSTADDHKPGTTSELQAELKEVGSEEKKQDVFDQEQAKTKEDSGEHMELPITQPPQMAEKFIAERSFDTSTDNTETMQIGTKIEEDKTDDEKEEEDEHDPDESGHEATVNEEDKGVEQKRTPKKSHGILSGVGSKVKHSIAKVKKAITGKSSHSKAQSAK